MGNTKSNTVRRRLKTLIELLWEHMLNSHNFSTHLELQVPWISTRLPKPKLSWQRVTRKETEERNHFRTEVTPMKSKCYISGKGTQASCAQSRLSSFARTVRFLAKLRSDMYRCCPHSCLYRLG